MLLKFATLTPLEPRLIKKLLPPLTSIIKTTPAMSLLYECINGIIQGGILQDAEGAAGEDIARLCVGKLRGMLVVEGDPNREKFNQKSVGKKMLTTCQSSTSLFCHSTKSWACIHI